MSDKIPFNRPVVIGDEYRYFEEVLASPQWSGDGPFTKRCQEHIKAELPEAKAVLLTHSCTAALEICAMCCNITPGAEVIMPSWTMTSTANAVVLRGGIPVFVDVEPETLNIDAEQIEHAITPKTAAIFVTHYAGVPCDMGSINETAQSNSLFVVEDAAQAYLSTYHGRPAGTLGHAAAISFHATKNIVSGEGGAFVTTLTRFARMAEIFREKGTDRSKMLRGEVDKYSWVDIGSSYLPNEITAAVLLAQLEFDHDLTAHRWMIWHYYDKMFRELNIPDINLCELTPDVRTNGHIYFFTLKAAYKRDWLLSILHENGIQASAHYEPLHNSLAGRKYCLTRGPGGTSTLPVTEHAAKAIVRLPMRVSIAEAERVVEAVKTALTSQ